MSSTRVDKDKLLDSVEFTAISDLQDTQSPDGEESASVTRRLTFLDGIGVSVGIIIGSGIFSSPGVALERSGSPAAALFAWIVAGCLVTCTSVCYFELGCMFPRAGGDFEYLTQAYGERISFSFAWFNFFISKPGSQAIIATIFGRYCETAITGNGLFSSNGSSSESPLVTGMAVGLIIVITFINCLGLKDSSILQNVLTLTKLCLVTSLFVIGISYASRRPAVIAQNLNIQSSSEGTSGFFSFGSALIACLWSFDGWADLNYMMEDLQNPQQNLPRVVLLGIFTVTVAYILANVAYFAVLSQSQIKESPAIAYAFGSEVSKTLPGWWASLLPAAIAFGVALSTAGSANGSIMTGGRAFFAVAREGKAPALFARQNAAGAPYPALIAQGLWSILLLLLPGSSFSSLLDYFGPASWFYYALTSSSVIMLRHKRPDLPRTFRVPLYPLPVIIVNVVAAIIVTSSFINEPAYTSLAFGFIALGVPVHILLELFVFHAPTDRARHRPLADRDDAEQEAL